MTKNKKIDPFELPEEERPETESDDTLELPRKEPDPDDTLEYNGEIY